MFKMSMYYNKLKTFFLYSLFSVAFVSGCQLSEESSREVFTNPSRSGYIEIDKGRLFFQRFGSGCPIVILHGGPGLSQNSLLPEMLKLAEDYELIFYDQRASGKSVSEQIDSQYVTIDQFAEDLERLRLGLGLERFVLMGHSFGALVAVNYAKMHPDVVSSLILVSSAPADHKSHMDFINDFIKKTEPIKDEIKSFLNYEDFEKLDEEEMRSLYKKLLPIYVYDRKKSNSLNIMNDKISAVHGAKVSELISKNDLFKSSFDLFPLMSAVKVRTLIMHGKQDIVPAKTSGKINEVMPDAELFYFEDCGHFPYVEKPAEFFARIRLFLEKAK